MNITDEEKQAAIEAGKKGVADAYEKSKAASGLKWWERLLWVVLAGAAAAASQLLTGCGQMRAWEELTPQQQQALQAADRAYHQWSGEVAADVAVATKEK